MSNRQAIMDALKSMGVKRVVVEYSGSGDSGQLYIIKFDKFDNLDIMAESRTVNVETESKRFEEGRWVRSKKFEEKKIEDAVREFCYDELGNHHGGWETIDGSRGEFVFDVLEDKIKLSHTDFYTESRLHEHDL